MKNVVKNTTVFRLLDLLCPFPCRGCGQWGAIICDCCKKNLLQAVCPLCPVCKTRLKVHRSTIRLPHCPDCELPFLGVCVAGTRDTALGQLVKDYKYHSTRAAEKFLAEILSAAIPKCPETEKLVVIPLPTISRHVRERGFDHTLRLARHLAKLRGWCCESLLERRGQTVQVGASRKQRETQAANAYAVRGRVIPEQPYLLLDDIWTTGASMLAAAETLRVAGAKKLVAAVLATGKISSETKSPAAAATGD